MKRVLLLKAGEVQPPLLTSHGDYDRWFQRALAGGCELVVVPAYRDALLPSVRGFDAVLMTGSPLSVTAPSPWMIRAGEYLLDAAERVPVLGVCFGHQLIGHALGTPVVKSPLGREIGTVEVDLTPAGRADPLFAGAPEHFAVQTTHQDVLEALPRGATLLAGNTHSPVQAFSVGPRLHGVQFHPEIDAATMTALIHARRVLLGARVPELLAGVRATAFADRTLRNFLA